jgi:hypothetical protein
MNSEQYEALALRRQVETLSAQVARLNEQERRKRVTKMVATALRKAQIVPVQCEKLVHLGMMSPKTLKGLLETMPEGSEFLKRCRKAALERKDEPTKAPEVREPAYFGEGFSKDMCISQLLLNVLPGLTGLLRRLGELRREEEAKQ